MLVYKAHLKAFPPLPEVSKLNVPFNKPDLKELGTIFAMYLSPYYGDGDFKGVRITPSWYSSRRLRPCCSIAYD